MKKILMVTGVCLLIATAGIAQKATVFNTAGTAINGYDAVAFFTQKKAVKGDTKFTYNWQNVNWLFASQEDADAFKAMPEKYAPQYGGYCAYGTSEGHKAPTEIDTWTVVGDKLYFNYNKKVQSFWLKDKTKLIEKADKQWPIIKDSE